MQVKHLFLMMGLCLGLLPAGVAAEASSPRIVSADAGVTAVLRALGADNHLVGIDVTSVQTDKKILPVVGYHRQLATEGLLALHPTLLIGGEHMGPPSTLSALEAAGVTVLRLPSVQDGDGLLSNIRQLAKVVVPPEQAKPVLDQVQQKITALKQQALPKNSRVLFLLSAGNRGLRAAGVGTGGDALIHLLGANNVMAHNSYQPISAEAIMAINPNVILLAADGSQNPMGDFLRDYPTLSVLKAAQAKNILAVRSETLVAGLSILTLDEALRLHEVMQKNTAQLAQKNL